MTQSTLYYIHDPMCSWCWAFRPTWGAIKVALAGTDINVQYVLGGLAPDSDEPMPNSTREYVRANWERIQRVVPNTEFNYDFWTQCQPRRSTFPACRAVIGAVQQGAEYEEAMVLAIQQAYYLHAKNPSDEATLCDCAASIGLNSDIFVDFIRSDRAQELLQAQFELVHQLASRTGAGGFPSLVLATGAEVSERGGVAGNMIAVPIDYNNPSVSLDFIRSHL